MFTVILNQVFTSRNQRRLMAKVTSITGTAFVAIFMSGCVSTDQPLPSYERSNIEWIDPSSYTDIQPTNQSKSRFQDNVFANLSKHVDKLAQDLPEGQVLKMKVTNVDLAGRIWPASFVGLGTSGVDVRLVKQIDIPRIKFSYQLVDASGDVIKSDDVNLRDMSFLDRASFHTNKGMLEYEKRMLKDWFNKTFAEQKV